MLLEMVSKTQYFFMSYFYITEPLKVNHAQDEKAMGRVGVKSLYAL